MHDNNIDMNVHGYQRLHTVTMARIFCASICLSLGLSPLPVFLDTLWQCSDKGGDGRQGNTDGLLAIALAATRSAGSK